MDKTKLTPATNHLNSGKREPIKDSLIRRFAHLSSTDGLIDELLSEHQKKNLIKIKVCKVGNTIMMDLPEEIAIKLHAVVGQHLNLFETSNGGYQLLPDEQ